MNGIHLYVSQVEPIVETRFFVPFLETPFSHRSPEVSLYRETEHIENSWTLGHRFPQPSNNTNMSLSTAFASEGILVLPVTMLYGGVQRADKRDLAFLCSQATLLNS